MTTDVTNAIRKQNIQAPAGTVGSMTAPDLQEWQYIGKLEDRLTTPKEFGEIFLKVDAAGNCGGGTEFSARFSLQCDSQ